MVLASSSPRNAGRGIAAITVAGRRSGLQLLAGIREGDLSRMGPIRAVAGAPSEYGDHIAGPHRFVSLPANPVEHRRRIAFKFPMLHGAVLVLHIHEEIEVWIGPLDFGDNARHRDRLGAVVLRPKR